MPKLNVTYVPENGLQQYALEKLEGKKFVLSFATVDTPRGPVKVAIFTSEDEIEVVLKN